MADVWAEKMAFIDRNSSSKVYKKVLIIRVLPTPELPFKKTCF